MIQGLLDLMKDNSRTELKRFNKIVRCVLAKWSRKINRILQHIRTENITDTSNLIKAVIVYVEKRLALKLVEVKIKRNQNPGGKEGLKKR